MAKTAKKAKSTKGSKEFKGDLPTIRAAIDKVAKEIQAGRDQAIEQIKKGKKAKRGTPEYEILAANKGSLEHAESILKGLSRAKALVQGECCNNQQGCNFLVIPAPYPRTGR